MNTDLAVFGPELARLDRLIEAEIHRLRARYELSLDEFRGLYITDERVEALLRARLPDAPDPMLDIEPARDADRASRWHQLAEALELSDDERDLLLVSLAPELDPRYETLYAYLNDDVSRRQPTADLAARLLARDGTDRWSLRAGLLPGSRLMAAGAIEPVPGPRETSVVDRGLRVATPLASWLQGLPYVDGRLEGIVRASGRRTIPFDGIPATVRSILAGIVDRMRAGDGVPTLVLIAPDAAEAVLLAEHLVAASEREALVVDLEALRHDPNPLDLAAALEFAARVRRQWLIVSPVDAAVEDDGHPHEPVVQVLRRLVRGRSDVIVAGTRPTAALAGDAGVLEVRVPEPAAPERVVAWRWAVATGMHVGTAAVVASLPALADRFTFGPARILRAVALADHRAVVAGRDDATREDLFAAARAVSSDGARGTTSVARTPFDWDDLILPAEAHSVLTDIVSAVELRGLVLDEWGFAASMGGTRGINVMFAGPAGTGKTMAAGIVAKTLGLELHRVELGATVSKYIGETEKNLDLAFAAARRANAVLFIDEADALFGKRSEVKDAHDRYANIEIAYLLQKMDDHDGVVILATNLARNIDEAFSRRMQFVLEFPFPDESSRERLWRAMVPPGAPLDDDVDIPFLARQFELTGADIRNVVLDAAYHAAQLDKSITLLQVLRAVARQFTKAGKVPTAVDFREHYGLLELDRSVAG